METETTAFPLPSSFPPPLRWLFSDWINCPPKSPSGGHTWWWPTLPGSWPAAQRQEIFREPKNDHKNRKNPFLSQFGKKTRFWRNPHQNKTDLSLLRLWEKVPTFCRVKPKRWPILRPRLSWPGVMLCVSFPAPILSCQPTLAPAK